MNVVYFLALFSPFLTVDCKFKNHVLAKQQKPLWSHLLTIVEIQRLNKEHFNVLADYAALCEFTIFDAYNYKSRCHYYDCNQMVEPSRWNAEMTKQFYLLKIDFLKKQSIFIWKIFIPL